MLDELKKKKKQGITDKKNYQKRKSNNTNTYMLTFNLPTIPKEIKICYINEKNRTIHSKPAQML